MYNYSPEFFEGILVILVIHIIWRILKTISKVSELFIFTFKPFAAFFLRVHRYSRIYLNIKK